MNKLHKNIFLWMLIFFLFLTNAFAASVPEPLTFPRDHGAHLETNVEWWNFFGHLVDSSQHMYGFALTFLRLDVPNQQTSSLWATNAVFVSYLTVTDDEQNKFYYQEKINRTSFNLAGASLDHLLVWNRGFSAEMKDEKLTLFALSKTMSLSLNLLPIKPLLLHGDNGFFQLEPSSDTHSYYYSYPRIQGSGELILNGEKHSIEAASISMDHAFQTMKNMHKIKNQFVIQLNNNEQIILYLQTSKDNFILPNSFCVISHATGDSKYLKVSDFELTTLATWQSPHSNITYPSKWLLTIPQEHYRLEITPMIQDQEIITLNSSFWQGEANVRGEKDGTSIAGNAYVDISRSDV